MGKILENYTKDFIVEFKALYNKCFNEDGSVKTCGRDACKKLIKFLNRNYTAQYGDEESGYMNIALINELHDAIKVEGSV